MLFNRMRAIVIVSLFVAAFGSSTVAWAQPWDVFEDALSPSVCDVVNTANAELVVLSDTGQLVIVTGADVILEDTFVDANNDVFFEGQPYGFLTFADDGDGFRTLWWVSLTGNVVHVDGFTGEPSETSLLPSDFTDVPDDACEFWDDPTVCYIPLPDSDLDGVPDPDDLCANTPLTENAYNDGCSCSQLDDDFDGVDNCVDQCSSTPVGQEVDVFGCTTRPTLVLCGSLGMLSLGLLVSGLFGLRLRSGP